MAEMQVQQIRAEALKITAALLAADPYRRSVLSSVGENERTLNADTRRLVEHVQRYITEGQWT